VLGNIPLQSISVELRQRLCEFYHGFHAVGRMTEMLQRPARELYRAMEVLYLRGGKGYYAFLSNLRALLTTQICSLSCAQGETHEELGVRRAELTQRLKKFFSSASSHKTRASGVRHTGGVAGSVTARALPASAGALKDEEAADRSVSFGVAAVRASRVGARPRAC